MKQGKKNGQQNDKQLPMPTAQTPLEIVREQQAMKQQNREVEQQRAEHSPEVPGASSPSNMRKHPQRKLG